MGAVAAIVWKEKEYELKYTFSIVRRMRAEGLNLPKTFREVLMDANAVADYGDEIASIIAWLLREAGCEGVTGEDVWRNSLSDPELQKSCVALFMWVANEHFAQSVNLPKK